MRRLLASLIVAAVVVPTTASAMTRQERNKLDHYKFYNTCATCPRGTMSSTVVRYDSNQVIDWQHKVQGVGVNRMGDRLFNFWQSGHMWANPPNSIKKMTWDAGTGVGNEWWNAYEEERKAREVHAGRGVNSYGSPYRYRRTEFVFKASYAAWTFNENAWAAQTFAADGSYTPAHN